MLGNGFIQTTPTEAAAMPNTISKHSPLGALLEHSNDGVLQVIVNDIGYKTIERTTGNLTLIGIDCDVLDSNGDVLRANVFVTISADNVETLTIGDKCNILTTRDSKNVFRSEIPYEGGTGATTNSNFDYDVEHGKLDSLQKRKLTVAAKNKNMAVKDYVTSELVPLMDEQTMLADLIG